MKSLDDKGGEIVDVHSTKTIRKGHYMLFFSISFDRTQKLNNFFTFTDFNKADFKTTLTLLSYIATYINND